MQEGRRQNFSPPAGRGAADKGCLLPRGTGSCWVRYRVHGRSEPMNVPCEGRRPLACRAVMRRLHSAALQCAAARVAADLQALSPLPEALPGAAAPAGRLLVNRGALRTNYSFIDSTREANQEAGRRVLLLTARS